MRFRVRKDRINGINATLKRPDAGIVKSYLDGLPAERETLKRKLEQLPPTRTGSWEEILIGDDPGRDHPLDHVGTPWPAEYKRNGIFEYKGYPDQWGQRNVRGYEKTIGLWYDPEFPLPQHNLFWFKAKLIYVEVGERQVKTWYFTYKKGEDLKVSEKDWTAAEKRDYITLHVTHPK
jgi:hypothetical protein